VLSFYLCFCPSWSIFLVKKPSRCSTSLISGGVSHTFAPLPKPERPSFTPDRVIRGSLGGGQFPFCLLKAGLLFKPGFLPVWWAGLQIGSWAFSGFLCATETCFPRQVPPSDQQICWDRWAGDVKSCWRGENTVSESWRNSQKCYGNLKLRHGTPRLFRKQYLLAFQQWLSRVTSKDWAPSTKGS
jgi:hypothetical protein